MDVVRKIEATNTDTRDKPLSTVTVADTHVEEVAEPYAVLKDDA